VAEALLTLAGVTKRFGALTVSDGVDLTLAPGEIHALIGPNGAGKTSLVHQIAGTLTPDAGAIRFDGRDITRLPVHERARLGLARSFQITSVVPSFTAAENVALAVQARQGRTFRFFVPASRDRSLRDGAMAALETVGLAERADHPAGSLSHGEKRSLELAIALALEPRVLLLDEPMAGTGHEESRRLVALLQGLRGRFAILLVEHDMQAVFALADRISVLVAGKVIASGAPDAVRADPAVRAAYLGEGEA
jgi:branched-chain amino acid transport system ATP-binding protein